ncbi:MAG TPA: TetR/AcrR family transcriptional regulator [Candidatus Dormibacteraeota bacterium]
MAAGVKTKRRYNATLRQEQAQQTRRRILDAGRRLLRRGAYSSVTMEEVAAEAGVSYQTVYAVFGNKLRVAQAIIEDGWPHIAEARKLLEEGRRSDDPEVWLRVAARLSRQILEVCADLPRFMRESGDSTLRARYRRVEDERYEELKEVRDLLQRSGRLRSSLSADEALALLWAFTGADWFCLLVFERGWQPERYEGWLAQSLIELLLEPLGGQRAPGPA